MKRAFLVLSLLLLTGLAKASDILWISSNTATADSAKVLCPQRANQVKLGHGMLHSVCVNFGVNPLAGTFQVFNASASATNPMLLIDTHNPGCYNYDIGFSSGLSYTSVSTSNVTAMYSCY